MSIGQSIGSSLGRAIGSSLSAGGGYASLVTNGVLAPYVTFTRASSGTYYDSAGVLQTALTDIPRIDYDPSTLALRGLLIEEARTNLLMYSADFSNAAWLANNTTVTTNTTAAPDGTTTADTITVDVSANANRRQTASCGALRYTFSVYLRAGTDSAVSFGIYQGGWVAQTGVIISGPGTLGGGSSYQTITGLSSSEWTRVAVTTDAAVSAGTLECYMYPGGVANTVGDTTICWGAQLEAGAFATSYIPTTSAAVTRAADVAVVSDLTDIAYNASGWTLYVECIAPPAVGAVHPGAVALVESGGATDNTSTIFFTPTSGNRVRGNTRTAAVSIEITGLTGYAIGATYKAALAVESGSQAISVNGGAPVTSASGIPNGLAKLLIGQRIDGSWHFGSHIKTLRYYPRRLTNAELVAMTA